MADHRRADNRCYMGHELTPENSYVKPSSGVVICRECARAHWRHYYRRRKKARQVSEGAST